MNKRMVITIIISLLLTVGIVGGFIYGVNEMSQPEDTVLIAVAKSEIKAGMILNPDMYGYIEIDKSEDSASYVHPESVISTDENGDQVSTVTDILKGKEANENIYPGERIMKVRVSGVGSEENAEIFENTDLRRMTYTSQGINNLAGQLQSGDRVDFWIRYSITDTINKDKVIVVDKILSNVPILKALDSNAQEIKSGTNPSTTIEVALSQSDIQEFIQWKGMGSITLVKVPVDANLSEETEITRRKMSMNDLTLEILSMTEDEMNIDDIVIDESKEDEVENYEITEDPETSN